PSAQPQIARSMRSPLPLAEASLLLIPALTGGAMLQGQQASAYVPLDDWTMPYVEHLIATGAIPDPAPLTRPLRRADVPRALAATRLQLDTRLKYDPDWFGKKDRAIAGRTAETYLDAQWTFGDVFFGRMDRNWGPPGIQGLLLSANPYGLDHFAISVGSAKLQFQAIATQLDDRDSMGLVVHRFMVQHRLLFAPERWGVALWEGTVLAGRDRSFEPWYLNALNVGILEQWNSGGNVNSFVGLDIEHRARVSAFGQLMLDDIQVDRAGAS